MQFYENLLNNLNSESLKTILATLETRAAGLRKKELADAINAIWIQAPQRLLNILSEPERLLLAESAHNYSEPDPVKLNAKYGFSYRIPYHTGYRSQLLAIRCFIYSDYNEYFLVDDIDERLRKLLPEPRPVEVAAIIELPKEGSWNIPTWRDKDNRETRSLREYKSELIAPAELRRLLQLTAAGKLRVGERTGVPSAATRKIVSEALCAPELELANQEQDDPDTQLPPEASRAHAWPILLQQCGWAKAKGGKLELTRQGKAIFENFTFALYAEGVKKFIADKNFDEMSQVSIIKGQSGRQTSRYRIAVPHRRYAIMDCIRSLPTGEWVELEEAYRILVASGGNCRVVSEGFCLYIYSQQYGHLGGSERMLGRVYFRQLAGNALATLGLIDLGYAAPHFLHPELYDSWGVDDEAFTTAYDGLKYIRTTKLGRFCLGTDASYEEPVAECSRMFKVLPNLEIVVTNPGEFSSADAAMLERFAKKKSDAVWKLDNSTILKALAAGDSEDDIIKIMRAGSDNELPITVLRLITDVASRANAAISQEDAVIVRFRDKETAALVEHDTAARKTILCRDGAALVVPKKSLKTFQTAARKLGILIS